MSVITTPQAETQMTGLTNKKKKKYNNHVFVLYRGPQQKSHIFSGVSVPSRHYSFHQPKGNVQRL